MDDETLTNLIRRIEELEARVRSLERADYDWV